MPVLRSKTPGGLPETMSLYRPAYFRTVKVSTRTAPIYYLTVPKLTSKPAEAKKKKKPAFWAPVDPPMYLY